LYNIFVVKRETFNTIAYSAAQKKIIKKTQLNLVKPCVLPDLLGNTCSKTIVFETGEDLTVEGTARNTLL